jgi:hypothetical protein
MIPAPVIARICAAVASLALPSASAADPLTPAPLTVDLLPPRLLADCDARAEPVERAAPQIARAAHALTDLGVLAAAAFDGARLGFCALQDAGGPVAAASCNDGVILLDEKYAVDGQSLVLLATLAHEMTHHLQHRARKARHGEAYCGSALYTEEKPGLEAAADAFGDGAAALYALGRAIEIVNTCDDPVSVFVEARDPVAVRGAQAAFQRVPARAAAIAPERALSGRLRFYAATAPATGPKHLWQDLASPYPRIVEGRLVRPRETRAAPTGPLKGPFRLRLSCTNNGD